MKQEYKVIIKNKFDYELEDKWNELIHDAEITFFQSYEWQKYWYEICGSNKKLVISLLYKNNKLISIFPLNIQEKKIFKILNWNGFPFSDYNKPIIRNDHVLQNDEIKFIFSKILEIQKFDAIHLINNIESNFFKKKIITNYSSKLSLSNFDSSNTIIDKFEKKLKYDENRLNKLFKLEICLNPSLEEKKDILNFFIKEKFSQLNRTRAWNYLKIQDNKEYIFNLINYDQKKIDFSCLKINNKIISSHIGYKYKNKFYYIFPVYDLKYKKYSPGNILLLRLINKYKSEEFKIIDFTIGKENYKKKISNINREIFDYMGKNSLIGSIYLIFMKAKIYIKKILL